MRNAVALRHGGEIGVCKKYKTGWKPTHKTEERMMKFGEKEREKGNVQYIIDL